MTNLSQVIQDERTARMLLSMIVEPDDAVTGRLLRELGALELFRLAEGKDAVPGLGAVDAQVWRAQFERSDARTLEQNLVGTERAGVGTLIPGDKEWPAALDDLGDRRPYVLWTRGTTSFLARPLSDLVTITGARASTSYGDHVAGQLASDLASAERIIVAGGAYGIEGAAHRAALASGGDTIAVVANGVDRMYPMGHRELLERVADLGLMVSEVPPGAVPTRHRFLARARLMATFSAVTIVVEAGVRSGSMTIARRAHELAHIMLKHDLAEIRELNGMPFRTCKPEEEEEATAFGGTLLLPRPLLLSAARRRTPVDQIASQYDVTVEMARFRYNTTGVAKQAVSR